MSIRIKINTVTISGRLGAKFIETSSQREVEGGATVNQSVMTFSIAQSVYTPTITDGKKEFKEREANWWKVYIYDARTIAYLKDQNLDKGDLILIVGGRIDNITITTPTGLKYAMTVIKVTNKSQVVILDSKTQRSNNFTSSEGDKDLPYGDTDEE